MLEGFVGLINPSLLVWREDKLPILHCYFTLFFIINGYLLT
ncbi:hypothetical protein PORCRE_1414 [Porphyromonas crevioricanis JCM 15906]|uniref:Uncharacterized protein n=1 Tax=Porphyromonas crevioricanis JCM 15906 TaxID=1305617 RepID=T1CPE9_9PORP|nr:hypothetical protein PORCRE_1414 [Porphyromonas crevioricanis JCM 15906]